MSYPQKGQQNQHVFIARGVPKAKDKVVLYTGGAFLKA